MRLVPLHTECVHPDCASTSGIGVDTRPSGS